MADTVDPGLSFESPIVTAYPDRPDAPVTLRDESGVAVIVVRAGRGAPARDQLGVAFGASRRVGDALVSGQRPDEWTVVGPAGAVAGVVEALDTTGFVSVVDLAHGRATLRLTGSVAPRVLEKICSTDLADDMTPDGAVWSASVAKVACDLVRDDVDGVTSYRISCDRSFGQWLFGAVLDAGEEFGAGVVP